MSLQEFEELTRALANLAIMCSMIIVTIYFILNMKKLLRSQNGSSAISKTDKKVTRNGNDL